MNSSRTSLKSSLNNTLSFFINDKDRYNTYYNDPAREYSQYANMLINSLAQICNGYTEKNEFATILKLHRLVVRQDEKLVARYYREEYKLPYEFYRALEIIVDGYYKIYITNKFVVWSSQCHSLLQHEMFDDEKQIDLVGADFNKFKYAIKPLLELMKLDHLNKDSCMTILNLEEFNDARILRLIINCIVNGMEVNQDNFADVKNILKELLMEIMDISGFDNQDEEKISDLIVYYIGSFIQISVKDEEVLLEIMDLLKHIIKNDPHVFFTNMFEETVTLQLPFVIKQLKDNHIFNAAMIKYLYLEPAFEKNSESGNQVVWLAEQSKKHAEKLASVKEKLNHVIHLKKKYDMALFLLIASERDESIFYFVPRELTWIILNLYSAFLPPVAKEKKPIPVCLFFNKPEKIIDNQKRDYETAFVKKS